MLLPQVVSLIDQQIQGAITYMQELYPDGAELTSYELKSKKENDAILIPALIDKNFKNLEQIHLASILHYVKMFEDSKREEEKSAMKNIYSLYKMEICRFQRVENGKWEAGILFNEGSGIILDRFGEKPEEVYDYKSGFVRFSIPIDLFLAQEQKYLESELETKGRMINYE